MAKPSSIRRSAIFSRILLRKSRIEMPPLIGSVGSMSAFLSMPWSLALSARADEARDAQAGDRGRVLEGEEHARAGRACPGESFEDVAALPDDLAAVDDVGRVAHQRVGEGRLARAVRAHDRVDLALADRQVDALEDLVLGAGDGRDAQAADDEVLVGRRSGRSRVGSGLPGVGSAGWGRRRSAMRGGTRSARVIESRAPATASRTRTHSTLTVQRDERSQTVGVLGVVAWRRSSGRSGPRGRAGPRPSGSSRAAGRARSRRARRACW